MSITSVIILRYTVDFAKSLQMSKNFTFCEINCKSITMDKWLMPFDF